VPISVMLPDTYLFARPQAKPKILPRVCDCGNRSKPCLCRVGQIVI